MSGGRGTDTGARLWVAVEDIATGELGRIVGPFTSMRAAEEFANAQPATRFRNDVPALWRIQTLDPVTKHG